MPDMLDDFLNKAQIKLSDVEQLFPLLQKNPADEKVWMTLDSFFHFIRSVSPFVGFMRSYRLADAGMREIRNYLSQQIGITVLPPILMKFQRVKKIITTAVHLKREPREADEDLFSDYNDQSSLCDENISVMPSIMPVSSDLAAQEAALDEREEQLVLWAQALQEQEMSLKQKENVLFEEEHRQALSQEKISAVMDRLKEQEKLQTDLEDHLAETRLALQSCQEKLVDREKQQLQAMQLLETKNDALSQMSQKIQDLTLLLEEKEDLSEQREEQLYRELQKNKQQAEELKLNLKTLEDFREEINKDHERISSQYAVLEQEYKNALEHLDKEKENTEQILQEKRNLEIQHIEFNTRFVALQESLNSEKENLKRTQKALDQQKKRNDFIWSELKASSWPYHAEKIQKDLAVLACQPKTQKSACSLESLKDLVSSIRMRSFVQIPDFLKKITQKSAKKYQRSYVLRMNCHIENGVDKDVLTVLEKILAELVDNAFHYAFANNPEELALTFCAKEEGALLICSFNDNGASFDFEKLNKAVQSAGLTDNMPVLNQSELLTYLFHPAVKFHEDQRGLLNIVRFLEKCGGRIHADFNQGVHLTFSIPKKFLFDKVLLFGQNGQRFALPLNAVAETVFLQESEFAIKTNEERKTSFFYWKGMSLPVLNFSQQACVEKMNYGLVVQAGIFYTLIPVQQIFDTEHLLAFYEKPNGTGAPYLISCTVLESGSEVLWVDLAELLTQVILPIPRKIISLQEKNASQSLESSNVSYLIYKSEPSIFGAVPVDRVLRVEDFCFPAASLIHKKYFETQGVRLPLKDSCSRDCYPYAQAVLIFDTFALAIQEVVDIIDIPNSDLNAEHIDSIIYRGRKVPVFSKEN